MNRFDIKVGNEQYTVTPSCTMTGTIFKVWIEEEEVEFEPCQGGLRAVPGSKADQELLQEIAREIDSYSL
ncbi:hypothetical protein SAMN05216436_12517 [bacterium A37T11]|nr:hypothetical protein SAMN05216436_12517 [bacterium A37T11]